jgi:hypothetical protein
MVHRHLVEETGPVLLPSKVEGMVHLKGNSVTMGVNKTIGVASRLFGTTDTLHSVALLQRVVGGIVIAVKASDA